MFYNLNQTREAEAQKSNICLAAYRKNKKVTNSSSSGASNYFSYSAMNK